MPDVIIATDLVTKNNREQEELSKSVFEFVLTGGKISKQHELMTGVENGDQIVYIGAMDDVGIEKNGCGGDGEANTLVFSDENWELKTVAGRLSYCATDLDPLFRLLAKRKEENPDMYNVIDSEEEKLIVTQYEKAIQKAINRIVNFSKKTHDHVVNGGQVTNGANLSLLNIIDGFWHNYITRVPAENIVAISQNAETSYAAQNALPDDAALKLLRAAHNKITPEMWEEVDNGGRLKFDLTPALARNWNDFLEDKSLAYMLNRTEDGALSDSYRGIEIEVRHDWAVNIKKFFDTGDKLDNPHRLLLTFKENIPVGTKDKKALEYIKVWYSDKDEKVYFDFRMKLGAHLLEPKKVILGI